MEKFFAKGNTYFSKAEIGEIITHIQNALKNTFGAHFSVRVEKTMSQMRGKSEIYYLYFNAPSYAQITSKDKAVRNAHGDRITRFKGFVVRLEKTTGYIRTLGKIAPMFRYEGDWYADGIMIAYRHRIPIGMPNKNGYVCGNDVSSLDFESGFKYLFNGTLGGAIKKPCKK